MLEDFIAFIKKENLLDRPGRTLLAISGGIDSVVMADLFQRAGFPFDMAHANFQLRGEESGRDEQFVRSLGQMVGAKVFVKCFDTAKCARENRISLQVAARQLRYEWFDELLRVHGYSQLATAHHLDDQVETFLINLTRGTGISGLHGIPLRQGKIIRPMMFAGRKEIEIYAAGHKLGYVEDSSNRSVKYTRNRIRHKVIPQLERINPSFRQEVTHTISIIRDAEAIYRDAIEQKRTGLFDEQDGKIYIPADQFFNLRPLLSWAYELLSPFGFNLSSIRDITGLADSIPGKEVTSATHRLIKDRDKLIIVPLEIKTSDKAYRVTLSDLMNDKISIPLDLKFEILENIPASYSDPGRNAYLDFDKLNFPLVIRRWKKGDHFIPLGMSRQKKLSDFFTDQKFSRIDKENQWLLCSGEYIVWIIGQRIDDRFKITGTSNRVLRISL